MMFLRKARYGSDYKSEILPQIQGMSNNKASLFPSQPLKSMISAIVGRRDDRNLLG